MTASIQTLVTDLTGVRRDLLRSVARVGPTRGAAVRDDVESVRGAVSHGQLYPNLDRLDDLGLIEKSQQSASRRSNQYAMTSRGWDVIAYFEGEYADAGEEEPEGVLA